MSLDTGNAESLHSDAFDRQRWGQESQNKKGTDPSLELHGLPSPAEPRRGHREESKTTPKTALISAIGTTFTPISFTG